mmetsp:Transcript_14790/g.20992  ORF Transcript_14790/g.20992 Transcript_14790/m.20992 type:complete len:93 (+) Transcript_14790:260-538(+)
MYFANSSMQIYPKINHGKSMNITTKNERRLEPFFLHLTFLKLSLERCKLLEEEFRLESNFSDKFDPSFLPAFDSGVGSGSMKELGATELSPF